MQRATAEPFVEEKPPRYTYPDPQTQAGRLQKQTDFLRFAHSTYPNRSASHERFILAARTALHLEQAIFRRDSARNAVFRGKTCR